jgi:hypothetical protein
MYTYNSLKWLSYFILLPGNIEANAIARYSVPAMLTGTGKHLVYVPWFIIQSYCYQVPVATEASLYTDNLTKNMQDYLKSTYFSQGTSRNENRLLFSFILMSAENPRNLVAKGFVHRSLTEPQWLNCYSQILTLLEEEIQANANVMCH